MGKRAALRVSFPIPAWYYEVESMIKLTTIFFLIAASILAVVHIVAIELVLYWRYAWFDIPMHVLGGTVIALGVFTIADLFPKFPKRLLYPIPVLLFVLLGSLAWEVYELGIGIPIEDDFEIDTSIDLFMDMLGGVVGYIVGYAVSTLDLDEDTYA